MKISTSLPLLKNIWVFLLLASGLCLPPRAAFASHIVAADMTYKATGQPNQYEFTLTLYRDCGSAIAMADTQRIYFNSLSASPTQIAVLLSIIGQAVDVSPSCPSQPSQCRGGTNAGVERYIYKGTLTLPAAAPDWVIYYRECNRSNSIETIRNPGSSCLYIEAGINNRDAPGNSSPTFGNDAASFVCAQQNVTLNSAANDPNNDRLIFRLATPRTNSPSPLDPGLVDFLAPFTATNPLPTTGGFSLDSLTGAMSFNAQRTIRAVTAQRIEEYRRGRLIGYIMRDQQLIVQDCNNALPRLAGINGTANSSITICANTNTVLTFHAADADAGDSVRIVSSALPAGAGFFSAPALGSTGTDASFQWTPTSADTGIRYLTLTTTDNSCPRTGTTSTTYAIRVIPGPLAQLRSDTTLVCGTYIPITVRFSGGTAPYRINWLGQNDTARTLHLSTGVYTVTVTDANGCASSDELSLGNPIMQVNFHADSVCAGDTAALVAVVTGIPPGSPLQYEWTFPGNYTSTLPRPHFAFGATPGSFPVLLRVTGPNGCQETVAKRITTCRAPLISPYITGPRCQGDPIRLNISVFDGPGACHAVSYALSLNRLGNVIGNALPLTVPSNLQIAGVNTGLVAVITQSGCVATKPITFSLDPKPQVAINPQSIFFRCDRPDTSFRVKVWRPDTSVHLGYQVHVAGLDTNFTTPYLTADTSYFTIPVRQVQTVSVTAKFTNGCTQIASAQVLFPFSARITSTPYCRAGDTVRLRKAVSAHWPIQYFRWGLGNGDTSSLDSPVPSYLPDSIFNISLILRDSTGCRDTINALVSTKLPDTTAFVVQDTGCYRTRVTVRYPNPDLIQNWRWFGTAGGDTSYFTTTSPHDSLLLTTPGRTPVSVRIRYKDVCVKTFVADTVFVRNPVKVNSLFSQVCADHPSLITGIGDSARYPIQRWYWQYFYKPALTTLVGQDEGRTVSHTFNRNGPLQVRLIAYDAKGCPGWDTINTATVLVSLPAFDVRGICERDSLFFFYGRVPDQYENITRFVYDFDDGTSQENTNGQVYHVYPHTGRYVIKLRAYSQEGCTNSDSSVLNILPRPVIVFSTDSTPCARTPIALDAHASRASAGSTAPLTFKWLLNRRLLATGADVQVQFDDPGRQLLTLIITDQNGCRDSLAVPLDVKPRPFAGFMYDSAQVENAGSLTFVNTSSGGAQWRWRFGDGDSVVTDKADDQTHHYSQGGQYTVRQLVGNGTGCADTATARLELRSYVALPQAFTPNGDGRNDALRLRHRFVKQLDEYRIYNRFGQAVFASSDPNEPWDGKIGGSEAPVGTYVYVVRATSVFGEELSLKGNIQLVR